MATERITNSFKVSPHLLGFIISAIVGVIGGSGTTAYIQQQPSPAHSQFVTRDEFERRFNDFAKRLDRIEEKIDRLTDRANQPSARR